MQLTHAVQIINRVRYDTRKATLLCDDVGWDGHNMERNGTNRWLFRSPGGRYFLRYRTQWAGDSDRIIPQTESEAVEFYEACNYWNTYLTFEEAFPTVKVEDA